MIECALFLLAAVAVAVVTVLWAWHDHVVSHPWAARPSGVVERFVDRWERTMIHVARKVPAMRHPVR